MLKLNLNISLILAVVVFNLISPSTGIACKYTVRDIGFTDLGSSSYKLLVFVNDSITGRTKESVEGIAYAALLETNVELQIINIDSPIKDPALKYLKEQKAPAFILLGPDGSSLSLPFRKEQWQVKEDVWRLLESVVASPVRDRIIGHVTEHYGMVMLIEGNDITMNTAARDAAIYAVNKISEAMTLMPKPIKRAPELMFLSNQDIQNERILLWSLNLPFSQMNKPQAVVLYSRGRRIGPVLRGTDITKDNIFRLLAIIGADCECGLDRSVMLGKMIPLRWEKSIQKELVEELGFDVENPMVKSEMQQILAMPAGSSRDEKYQNPLAVYEEDILTADSKTEIPTVSSSLFRQTRFPQSSTGQISSVSVILISFGILILFAIACGGFIYLKNKKRTGKPD